MPRALIVCEQAPNPDPSRKRLQRTNLAAISRRPGPCLYGVFLHLTNAVDPIPAGFQLSACSQSGEQANGNLCKGVGPSVGCVSRTTYNLCDTSSGPSGTGTFVVAEVDDARH